MFRKISRMNEITSQARNLLLGREKYYDRCVNCIRVRSVVDSKYKSKGSLICDDIRNAKLQVDGSSFPNVDEIEDCQHRATVV